MASDAPIFQWKIISIFIVVILIFFLLLLFFLYPEKMMMSLWIFPFFSIVFLLSLLIPDNLTPNLGGAASWLKIFIRSIPIFLVEFSLYCLSNHFNFLLLSTKITLPSWPLWLGLWGFFSTTLAMQHYAAYQLHQPNIASSFLLHRQNIYADIAWRRAFGFVSFGVNLTAMYLLSEALLFALLTYLPTESNNHSSILPSAFFILMLFAALLLYFPKISQQWRNFSLPNYSYFLLAIFIGFVAIFISRWLNNHMAQSFILENSATPIKHTDILLFSTFFIAITPMFASIIVKYSKGCSRKKLASTAFVLPIFFYALLKHHLSLFDGIMNNQLLFIILGCIFLIVLLSGKTTGNFLSGAVPLPKQKVILSTKNLKLFPAHCLILFNFYLLFSTRGTLGLCAITTSAALLAACIGVVGICSYFAVTYRKKLLFPPPTQK